jgi:predicted nucleic acid-binding protein
MNSYVLDTYAWVEYFRGTNLADKVEGILKEKCFTPTIVIAELQTKFLKENLDFTQAVNFIEAKTITIPLTTNIAILAGKNKLRKKKA